MSNLHVLAIELRKYLYSEHETIAYVVLLQNLPTKNFLKKNNSFIKIINFFIDIIQYLKLNPINYFLKT